MDLSAGVKVEGKTEFLGYEGVSDVGQVVALLKGGAAVQALAAGEEGEVVLDRTPFYAESGGQVGDTGELGNVSARFVVADTQKRGAAFSHLGKLEKGEISRRRQARRESGRRPPQAPSWPTTRPHIYCTPRLRKVLGTHVQQKGSLVAPDRLRFDFSHFQAITPEELKRIERLVNAEIRANAAAETREMPYDAAVAEGAIALFGEKYEKDVRVLRMGEFSMELCGGTHVARTGDIGIFKIVSEGGVAAGVRRIEAITAEGALDYVEQTDQLVKEVAGLVRGSRDDVKAKVADALERIRQLEKENRQLKDKLASGQGTDLSAGARDIAGVKLRRRAGRRRRRRRVAQRGRSAQGQAQERDHRAGLRGCHQQDHAGGGRDGRPDRQDQGRRARRQCRRPGRRQGRRPAGFRAGRRQQSCGARRGAGQRRRLRARQARSVKGDILQRRMPTWVRV